MGLSRIDGPDAEPLTLQEAKAHLRVDHTDEDTLITAYIQAAREHVEAILNRSLVRTYWRLTLPEFPTNGINLPQGRTLAVLQIAYTAPDGSTGYLYGPSAAVSPEPAISPAPAAGADFREDLSNEDGGRILPPWGDNWPNTRSDTPDAVRVDFLAGYGASASSVPEAIKAALRFHLGDLYEHRSGQDGTLSTVPKTLLLPYALRDGRHG